MPAGKSPEKRSELEIQTLFRSRARIQCPRVRVVAIPNAGKRRQRAMNQARREGAAWGFPDVMCLAEGRVAFIEFKAAKGQLSDNQADWLDWLTADGFPATVARDPDDALAFLRRNGFPFLDTEPSTRVNGGPPTPSRPLGHGIAA